MQDYPYPWVTWSHRDLLPQNTSNVDLQTRLKICNFTVLEGGLYTCYAKNDNDNDKNNDKLKFIPYLNRTPKIGQRVIICKFLKRSSPKTPDKKSEKKGGTNNESKNDTNSYDIKIKN